MKQTYLTIIAVSLAAPWLAIIFASPDPSVVDGLSSSVDVIALLQMIAGMFSIDDPAVENENQEPCFERCCTKPSYTAPVTLCNGILDASPYSVSFLPKNNNTEQMDNVCYSFFQLQANYSLLSIAIVFKNNTMQQYNYVVGDAPCPGVITGAGPTCTYQDYIISVQCNETLIIKRCFDIGICSQFDASIQNENFTYLGISSLPQQSNACKDQQIAFVNSLSNDGTIEYVKLPQQLPLQCVSCLPSNGIAFNSINVPPQEQTCAVSTCPLANSQRNTTYIQVMYEVLAQYQNKNQRCGSSASTCGQVNNCFCGTRN